LHVIDMAPLEGTGRPVEDAQSILNELDKFSPELAERERWLVLNKADLLDAEDCAQVESDVVAALKWEGHVYRISAVSGQGTRKLAGDIMSRLEEIKQDAADETQAEKPYSPI